MEETNITTITSYHTADEFFTQVGKQRFIDFLYTHLDEFGDKKTDIEKAIDYAFSDETGKGGFIVVAIDDEQIVGGVVMNRTGMKGYIPENILVYIAVHNEWRGKGLGTKLMEKVQQECKGDIALHVEYDNPATFLYKKVGFTSKYKEMRYHK